MERPRAVRTLLCLYKNEGKGLDELLELIGGSKSTGMKRITEFMSLGLVEKKAGKERRKVVYYLTSRGRKVAELLEKAIKIIEEGCEL